MLQTLTQIRRFVSHLRLGMMNMFGGFTQDFFQAYHEVIPKTEPYYDERLLLYELYHQ